MSVTETEPTGMRAANSDSEKRSPSELVNCKGNGGKHTKMQGMSTSTGTALTLTLTAVQVLLFFHRFDFCARKVVTVLNRCHCSVFSQVHRVQQPAAGALVKSLWLGSVLRK